MSNPDKKEAVIGIFSIIFILAVGGALYYFWNSAQQKNQVPISTEQTKPTQEMVNSFKSSASIPVQNIPPVNTMTSTTSSQQSTNNSGRPSAESLLEMLHKQQNTQQNPPGSN